MASIELLVTPAGECRYLQTPESVHLFSKQQKTVRRISHVEPVDRRLRVAFRVLRFCFGEYGRAAAWTRRWPCRWQVNFGPIGGPVFVADLDGSVFQGRQAAIDFEVGFASVYQERIEDDHVGSFTESWRIYQARRRHHDLDREDQGTRRADRD